jgi:nucleoside-diphosphate kinase
MATELQQTLVLIKPDALKLSLTHYVLDRLAETHTGLIYAGMKVVHVSDELAGEHYAEHREKPFFHDLADHITGRLHYPDEPDKRRVIAISYHGENAIKKVREIVGPTNPVVAREEQPMTIRALGTIIHITDRLGRRIGERYDNLVHASSDPAAGEREVKLWFRPGEIPTELRLWPTEEAGKHIYYKDGAIYNRYVKGMACFISSSELIWKSDLDDLLEYMKTNGKPKQALSAIIAKYRINRAPPDEELPPVPS